MRIYMFNRLLFILLILQSCTASNDSIIKDSTLKKVLNERVLHVGYIIYPPTVQIDPNTGELSGHFVDAVEELALNMGVKVEYHETDWTNFISGLKTGQFDLSIAATYRTIPRAKEIAFTHELMFIGNSAIVSKNENRFSNIQDLNRKDITIAVTQGEQGHEYAKVYLSLARLKVLSTSDQSLAFAEVSAKRVDAALGDSWACKKYAEAHDEVIDLLANNPYNLSPVGWAVRYGDPDWLSFLNTAIMTLESTGKLREFEEKYHAHWIHRKFIWETW